MDCFFRDPRQRRGGSRARAKGDSTGSSRERGRSSGPLRSKLLSWKTAEERCAVLICEMRGEDIALSRGVAGPKLFRYVNPVNLHGRRLFWRHKYLAPAERRAGLHRQSVEIR